MKTKIKFDYENLLGTFEQKQAIVNSFNLMDDDFFSEVMKDKAACEYVLREITGIKDLTVIDVKIQYALRNIGTHSVTLDVLAEDSNSKLYNIEVQKPDNDYHPRRMRYYQSNIDISYFEKGKKYMELPDIYLIYITLFDVFKLGDNCYHIKRIIDGHGVESDNGVHEIYLNTAVKTDKPITRLMEYFKNTDADRADFGPLSDKVRNIKHTNQGVNSMSEAVLEMAERYAQKKLEEQKKEMNEAVQEMMERYAQKKIAEQIEETEKQLEEQKKENQKQLEEQKKENQRKLAQQRQNTIENMRAKGLSEELIMEIIGEQL